MDLTLYACEMIERVRLTSAAVMFCAMSIAPCLAASHELPYACSVPPLEVGFAIVGGHYSGAVTCGNLFLAADIPAAPVVRWTKAEAGKLYTLMMLDFDGNAAGSWPDPVAPGSNSPVRHWIVGNLSGDLLRGEGYRELATVAGAARLNVLQRYRAPHIPVVSDRYGVYLFQQDKEIQFEPAPDPITNFDYISFLNRYGLAEPVASTFFVALHTSESPFSGKAIHGNDLSGIWHEGLGKGKLVPGPQ